MEEIRKRLFALQDLSYRDFQSTLMPDIDKERIIGIRTPQLRALAKEIWREGKAGTVFFGQPHFYYEEKNLHGMLIEFIRDYDTCIAELERFLPSVDNWATCDMVSPKVLGKHRERLLEQISLWLQSDHVFTVRYGLGMLMRYYLDEDFKPEYLRMAAETDREAYYVRMMVAWYFATALYKQYDSAIPFIEKRRLPQWTHNKAISKACDSKRITEKQKAYLRSLRWK